MPNGTFDDERDDPEVPSPIDSDAPASVHGGNNTPLPFRIVER